MVFVLAIQTYFWLVDRAEIENDQRNQVSNEKQLVFLYKDHNSRIENGFYLGKIMQAIRKTKVKFSRKPFFLDPALANLIDESNKQAREFNWNLIVQQLIKFNIIVSESNKL
jgi:hypothetical protein